MMFSTPTGPPRCKPTPLDGPVLQIHPHRRGTIDATERRFVRLFLRRYVVWCARRERVSQAQSALALLLEVAGPRV